MQIYKLHVTKRKLHEVLFGTTSTGGTKSACKHCTETAIRYQQATHEAVRINFTFM
jgi:hypothetical protein